MLVVTNKQRNQKEKKKIDTDKKDDWLNNENESYNKKHNIHCYFVASQDIIKEIVRVKNKIDNGNIVKDSQDMEDANNGQWDTAESLKVVNLRGQFLLLWCI